MPPVVIEQAEIQHYTVMLHWHFNDVTYAPCILQ